MPCKRLVKIFLSVFLWLKLVEASSILICVPCPSISHQVVFYPLVKELIRRGHEVVFITTDPMYPEGGSPANLTEVNTHDVSYQAWKEQVLWNGDMTQGDKSIQYKIFSIIMPLIAKSFEAQMQTPEVQNMIKEKKHFDLLIVEANAKSAQVLSHVFQAPMILMSSLGGMQDNYRVIGAPIYPKLLYPIFWHQKLNNLTILEKLRVLWDTYKIERFLEVFEAEENEMIKKLFGPDTPTLDELGNNVEMLFLNVYPVWEYNRPVPPGVVFIGGMHQNPEKDLPKDLQSYLDASERGVVYFSLGTNVSPATLSADKIRAITNGLAKLTYDVLVKWDSKNLPGKGNNTRVAKWYPQSDLLRHPNIKAFVTQGGIQSFDEALSGGVPLVGVPMIGDQWYNVERLEALKIGVGITEELTEYILANAVNTVIDDPSYRQNMIALRDRIRDQPQSALDHAVWWIEHIIRHKGASYLRAPAANMSWIEYIDLELISVIGLIIFSLLAFVSVIFYVTLRFVWRLVCGSMKLKTQ